MLTVIAKKQKQQGLSLIELMIALALGLILTLGVTQIFLGSNQTYRLTGSIGKIQEDLRYSVSTLTREVRKAGGYGCLVEEPALHPAVSSAMPYDPFNAVMGWGYSGTSLGDSYTISTVSPVTSGWTNGSGDSVPDVITDDGAIPGTDMVLINNVRRLDIELDGTSPRGSAAFDTDGETGIKKNTIVLVVASDCSGGDLFQNSNEKTDESLEMDGSGGSSTEYDDKAAVYEYTSTLYYVGEGSSGEPALYRKRLDPGGLDDATELVEGVENMQVLYRVGTKNNDKYVPSSGVSDWTTVVSVRIALLTRSADNVRDEAGAQMFNLTGVEVTTASDKRVRLVGTSTIALRNRLD